MPTTQRLQNILDKCRMDGLRQYWEESREETGLDFPGYMDRILRDRQMSRREVLRRADIPEKYGYRILDGSRRTVDRDRLLKIFLAAHMKPEEVQRALALYGMPALYPRNPRDNVFYLAFRNRLWSVDKVDEWLRYYDLKPLAIGIGED